MKGTEKLGNEEPTWLDMTNPNPNFELTMGDDGEDVTFNFRVKKTLLNRLKYWLFCKFFPFRVTRWDKDEENGNKGTGEDSE